MGRGRRTLEGQNERREIDQVVLLKDHHKNREKVELQHTVLILSY